tara:strand:- start:137 stop:739 length:603 start_codon:yes stop_codon:yes gene_type:complete
MNKYYKILGLESSANFEEVTNKYNELSKEFDPSNQADDLKEFFITEQKKLDDAFEMISSSILKDNPISDNIVDENNNEDLSAEEKNSDDKDSASNSEVNSISRDDITHENISSGKSKQVVVNNALLLVIAIGIWGLFMQNMGLFVPSDDFTQKVRVVNTVDTEVQGSVNVFGQVEVENTVSVSIDEVLDKNGKKYYYNNR